MTAIINPSILCGTITAPPSKSSAHRSLICAALSNGCVTIKNCGNSNDIAATCNVLKSLGSQITVTGKDISISPALKNQKNIVLDCGESGSTARFILPVAAALGVENATIIGHGRLPLRPFGALTEVLRKNGVNCSSDCLPITISGKLKCGKFELPGNISSQYISGLLFALSVVQGESEIILTSPLESAAYVDMTVNELIKFGADIKKAKNGYKIIGKSTLNSTECTVEGDWSQAAFFLSAGAILGDITVEGINKNSLQGDKQIVDLLKRFGADVIEYEDKVTVKKSKLTAINIDASQIPDLVPILAVTAALAVGTTVIYNASRLRLKESDRLKETVARLNEFGIKATETCDGMTITGGKPINANISSGNDHRLVMAFSILALACDKASSITNCEAINKSYPDFFKDFMNLGGNCNVI